MSGASKPSLLRTVIFLTLATVAYLVIFFNIELLNQFFTSKGMIPALCLLSTVVGIAFLYGTAMSYLLCLIGLESEH